MKKSLSAIGLILTCGFALLSWNEAEAADTECAADADCTAGEYCIVALDPPVCKAPQADGAACKRDVVCASSHCAIPEGATAGVCAAPAPPPTCAADADCTAGEYCIVALDPPVCKAPQADGAACKRDVVCASGHCDIPEDATAGVCATPAPAPTCAADTDCTAGEYCIVALDPPICKAPQADGAACKRDVVCASSHCAIPEGATAGVCSTPTCAADADCAVGQYCIVALDPPVCKAPQADGAACKRDVVCASGHCAIPEGATAGVCATP